MRESAWEEIVLLSWQEGGIPWRDENSIEDRLQPCG
jgi:hypothetical protein